MNQKYLSAISFLLVAYIALQIQFIKATTPTPPSETSSQPQSEGQQQPDAAPPVQQPAQQNPISTTTASTQTDAKKNVKPEDAVKSEDKGSWYGNLWKNHKWFVIFAICLFLIALTLSGYYLYSKMSESK